MKKIYLCRLCGKIVYEEYIDDIKANIEFANMKNTDTTSRHYCEDGNFGITELVGYVKD